MNEPKERSFGFFCLDHFIIERVTIQLLLSRAACVGLCVMKFLTRLRPRSLDCTNSAFGLRHARRPAGRCLRPCWVPQKFHRVAPGTCGVGGKAGQFRAPAPGHAVPGSVLLTYPCARVKQKLNSRCIFVSAVPWENPGRRPRTRVKHFRLFEPEGRVSKMYRGRPSVPYRIFAGGILWVTLSSGKQER